MLKLGVDELAENLHKNAQAGSQCLTEQHYEVAVGLDIVPPYHSEVARNRYYHL